MTNQRVAGRYTLRRTVGHGASGAVWLAHDEVLHRSVALKRIGAVSGPAEDAVRAEREARLAAQVAHPHVVGVYDLATDEEGTWLVMEYVDGPTLSTIVRETGPLSPDRAARLLAPVADALAHAHALGIVHRDIKPSNILAPGDGGTKLSDFGIARSAGDATLTQTGLVTGSPAYLAPEVATGSQATTASDVWSFGATLVHLLTGRPPYHREDQDNSPLSVVYRIAHEPAPTVPTAGWLAPLLTEMLQKDPDLRPTMAGVRDRLEHSAGLAEHTMALPAMTAPPAPPAPAPATPVSLAGPGTRRTLLAVGGVVAALTVLVLAAVLLLSGRDEAGPERTAGGTSSKTGPPASTTAPTAEEMEAFAREYVRTADADPAAGFAMLTAGYQAESPEYSEFWGPMKSPEITAISADPEAMTVTYTYNYVFPGKGREEETVTLRLVDENGSLLIAGAG